MSRGAFSVVEILVVVLAGVALLSVAYDSFVSSSRVLTRGQNKMVATGQAELLFRYLENDMHTLRAVPAPPPAPPAFTLVRAIARAASAPQIVNVTWRFHVGVDGHDSYVERSVDGLTPPEPPTRLCVGALAAVVMAPVSDPAHPGVSIKVTLKSEQDVQPAIFQETFFYQNQVPDPFWNPIAN